MNREKKYNLVFYRLCFLPFLEENEKCDYVVMENSMSFLLEKPITN